MTKLTPQQQAVLSRYFTNLDQDVFVLINLPEVVKGALFSRYSRSPKSLRQLLWDEFITQADETGFDQLVAQASVTDQMVAADKAEAFYDRVLVGFGDDSVAELAGVHLAVENVSQIVVKNYLEDNRIGISPLEKSTRYVRYDDKVDGRYRYYLEPELMASQFGAEYQQVNQLLFETYSRLVQAMLDWVKQRYPKPADTKQWVYNSTVRAKACDICRELLPMSTLTNVGLYGNGRAFEYLIIKLMASDLAEARQVGKSIKAELDKVIPSFVKRSTNQRGKQWQTYLANTRQAVSDWLAQQTLPSAQPPANKNYVKLISFQPDGEDRVLAGMIYQPLQINYQQALSWVQSLPVTQKRQLAQAYCSQRQNRHHKLGRALEMTDYIFEVVADIGSYRDLQRHRMLTRLTQSYTTDYGYNLPWQIVKAGFEAEYRQAMQAAAELFDKVRQKYPEQAQYMVPLGYKMRWLFKLNMREIVHLTELRSTKQGHPGYRVIAQQMADAVKSVHPLLGKWATYYVDYQSVDLERLEAEKRTEKKRQALLQKQSHSL